MALHTLAGISQAIDNLNLKEVTLKSKLLQAIERRFPDQACLDSVTAIDALDLIKELWSPKTAKEITAKRKNLSSLKSSINKSLKEGLKSGANPEGLVIGRDNVFVISDEKKDLLLDKLSVSGAGEGDSLLSALAALNDILSGIDKPGDQHQALQILDQLDTARKTLTKLAGLSEEGEGESPGSRAGVGAGDGDGDEADDYGQVEEFEVDEDTVIEFVDEEIIPGPAEGDQPTHTEGSAGDGGDAAGFTGIDHFDRAGGGEKQPLDAGSENGAEGPGPANGASAPADDSPLASGAPGPEDDWDSFEVIDDDFDIIDADDLPALGEEGGQEDENKSESLDEGDEVLEDEAVRQEELEVTEELDTEEVVVEQELEEIIEADEGVEAELEADEGGTGGEDTLGKTEAGDASTGVTPAGATESDLGLGIDSKGPSPDQGGKGDHLTDGPGAEEDDWDSFEVIDDDFDIIDADELPALEGESDQKVKDDLEILDEGDDVLEEEIELGEELETVEEIDAEEGERGEELEEIDDTELIEAEQQPAPIDDIDSDEGLIEIAEDNFAQAEEPEIGDDLDLIDSEDLAEPQAGTGQDLEPLLADLDIVDEVNEQEASPGDGLEPAEGIETKEIIEEEDWDSFEVSDEGPDFQQSADAKGSSGSSALGPLDRAMDISHYIEAEEALVYIPDVLQEHNDEYIRQIVERFMPKSIKIPKGLYPVGGPKKRQTDRALTQVSLKDFYIGQLPITNDLFDFFVRETGYETEAELQGHGLVASARLRSEVEQRTGRHTLAISKGVLTRQIRGANWRHPDGPGSSLENRSHHPVVQISRLDALTFAAWAGKRLPSEDEWEAAARGREGYLFPWGEEFLPLANLEGQQTGSTMPVTYFGRQSLSPFGLLDMIGNVFEWTSSTYNSQNGRELTILKGGSWATARITCADRLIEPASTWSNTIGFRCAVDAE